MAVEKQEEILEMVREQLGRTNPPGTEALYGRAARIDDGVKELTLRQFNARFPLRVRREMARAKTSEEEKATPEEAGDETAKADRDAIRSVLLDFARAVADTPKGPEFVDLITSDVQAYIDRLEEACFDMK